MLTIYCCQILVSAPTGTGKTASYLIPAIAQVLLAREEEEEVLALVLAPVRELAIQIETVAKLLMRGIADMKTAFLVGGFPVPTQRYRLQGGV
ncbi:P-loop containing nucleoside triphosphate hydrolase [Phytophthora cactorum]|nr:P-loop containing nucleoside triphosphate hydrolase [Phytophthora cactorum]